MRVAVVQQSPREDRAASAALQGDLIRAGADAGARLVVLPEGGYAGLAASAESARAVAEPPDGPYVESLAALTGTLGIAVVANYYELAQRDGRAVVFNTSVLLERGVPRRAYRKVHLFDAQGWRESDVVAPGDPGQVGEPPEQVDGVAVGLLTCFDLRFAEQAVSLARGGAELLCVPAAWVAGTRKARQWELLLRARALETGSFVAGAAQPAPTYCGGSGVYGPDGEAAGEVLGEHGEGSVAADVDVDAVAAARAATPTLAARPMWPT